MEDWKGELKSFLKRVSGKNRFQDIADDLGIKFKSLSAYFEKDNNAMPLDFVAIVAHHYNLSASDVEQLADIVCRSHSLFVDLKKMEESELMAWLHFSLTLSTMDDGQKKEFDEKLWTGYVSTLPAGNGLDGEADGIAREITEDPNVLDAWNTQADTEGLSSVPLLPFVRSCFSDNEILETARNGGQRDLYDLLLKKCSELLPAVREKKELRKAVIGKIGDFLYYEYGKHQRDKKEETTSPETPQANGVPNMDVHEGSSLKNTIPGGVSNQDASPSGDAGVKVDVNGQQYFCEREVRYVPKAKDDVT